MNEKKSKNSILFLYTEVHLYCINKQKKLKNKFICMLTILLYKIQNKKKRTNITTICSIIVYTVVFSRYCLNKTVMFIYFILVLRLLYICICTI